MCNISLQKLAEFSTPMILVVNKIDCTPSSSTEWINKESCSFRKLVFTCAVTGQGIQDLEKAISDIVGLNQIAAGGRKWTVNQVSDLMDMKSFFCTSSGIDVDCMLYIFSDSVSS